MLLKAIIPGILAGLTIANGILYIREGNIIGFPIFVLGLLFFVLHYRYLGRCKK